MINRLKALLFSQTSKDTFVSLIGTGVSAIFGTIFTVLLARSLSPSPFGVYSSLAAAITIITTLGDLGISSALVNFLPKMPDKRKQLISSTFYFQSAIAAVSTLFFAAATFFYQTLIPGSLPSQFIIAAVLIGTYILNQYALGVLRAERKFTQSSIVMVIDSGVKLLLVGLLFYYRTLTINQVLLANSVSVILATIYAFRHEFSNLSPIFPKMYLKKIFKFAKWIGLSRAFSVAVARVDIILLNLLHSSFAAGIFAAAGRVTFLFTLLVSALGSVVAPRFSSFTGKKDTLAYLKKLSILIGVVSLFMILTVFLAEPIITIVFGSEYLEAIPVFQVLALAMIPFLFSIATTNPIIYTFNQPRFFANITILQVVILIVLDIILIPTYGAMAPCISIGISNTIVFILSSVKLARLLHEA